VDRRRHHANEVWVNLIPTHSISEDSSHIKQRPTKRRPHNYKTKTHTPKTPRLQNKDPFSLWTPKVGKGRKSLTNPGSGGKGRNFIIPFARKRLILPYFYSVLYTLAMWNWNKGGFACTCNIVKARQIKGRQIKQRGVKNRNSFKRWGLELAGIRIFRSKI
jgi:hypothetical protein